MLVKCHFATDWLIKDKEVKKMLRKDLIISKTRNLLNEFMYPIMAEADKPRRKFLHQALGAILLSGSLIVSEFARWIHDDCSDIF